VLGLAVIAFDVEGNAKKCQILRHGERCLSRHRGLRGRLLASWIAGICAGSQAGFATGTGALGRAAAQSSIEGVDSWADAVNSRAVKRWVGQRLAFPAPEPRPASAGRVDSLLVPLSVHAQQGVPAGRIDATLRCAESSYALLAAAGLFEAHGDGGQGGTWGRDLYLVNGAESGARLDASEPQGDVDGARAFALLDARVPAEQLLACTAQALVEAELFELDPAEAEIVRKGSAAYFAWLVSGDSCGAGLADADTRGTLSDPAAFFGFLRALGTRMDQNSGSFLQAMWHFARQRTWEGSGLRGSPDLLEAIAKALTLDHSKLEEVSGELANRRALQEPDALLQSVPRSTWSMLPVHLAPITPALAPLDSAYALVDLQGPRPDRQLTVWSRGEQGVRWVLSATKLDAAGRALGSVDAPVRNYPDAELHVELDARARFVLVSLTNLANGTPDPDLARPVQRSARLIIDADRGPAK
jgi:hypothetical protein